ncbi:polyamine aminopropyltransferase [Parachitinimonas caeni]|uniref:Polyamine aminopropyltransferase n=1 Tax=Parachitinimonas caeni TaxID=3031301 RepID=A0ABT7E4M4_9NEIS|nr:polyamine aminopropyltransferase [Parachitinimonas caeni]MDK2126308.1 polyamine aminopropyltransferase [Parachitinimonas caeni]
MRRFGKRASASWVDEVPVDVSEKDGIRSLHLGSDAIQSSMRVRDPVELVLAYSRCMLAFLLFREEPERAVVVGLGGGSLPKFFYHHMPSCSIAAIELHPQVVAVARSMFFLPPDDERLSVQIGDGAQAIASMEEVSSVIVLDAYGPAGIATALSTEDFFSCCRDKLESNGVLLVNLWGSDPKFTTYVDRISNSFEGRVLCLPARQKGNVVVLAFKSGQGSPAWSRLTDRARELEKKYPLEFSEFVSDLARMNPHNDRRLLI